MFFPFEMNNLSAILQRLDNEVCGPGLFSTALNLSMNICLMCWRTSELIPVSVRLRS